MEEMEIKTSKIYIEDILYPQPRRIVKEVLSVNTSKNYLDFELGSLNDFSVLTDVIAKGLNLDSKLSSENLNDDKGTVRVSLGNLDDWPSVPQSTIESPRTGFKHVKLEIKYSMIMKEFPIFF